MLSFYTFSIVGGGGRLSSSTDMSSLSPFSIVGSAGLLSSSTLSTVTVTGSHVLKVEGYSKTKGLPAGRRISSSTFVVGGHTWYFGYIPGGFGFQSYKFIGVDLNLHRPTSKDQLNCNITVINEFCAEDTTEGSLTVPPPDLHRHLGDLLASQFPGDVTFEVGGELLTAHRVVLAAWSSVFMAELFGPMKENGTDRVHIDDMEARVFKAMLHFIYTDLVPEMDEDDKIVMSQHLLVAADRYNLEKLKLICENIL
ncbi:hypothetical protein ACP4OV_002405 [Aristida adscensionis]